MNSLLIVADLEDAEIDTDMDVDADGQYVNLTSISHIESIAPDEQGQ